MRYLMIFCLALSTTTCKTRRPNLASSSGLRGSADGRTTIESDDFVQPVIRMDIVVPDDEDGLGLTSGSVFELDDEEKIAALLFGTAALGAAYGYLARGPGKAPDLAKQIEGKNSDISSLTRRNSSLAAESKKLQQQLEAAQRDVATGKVGADELEELRNAKAATDKELQAAQEELASVRNSSDESLADLQKKKQELEARLRQAEDEVTAGKAGSKELEKLKAENAKLQQRLQKTLVEKNKNAVLWKRKLDELGKGNQNLTDQLAAAQKKVGDLEKQVKDSGGKNTALTEELAGAQAELAEATGKLEKAHTELRRVTTELRLSRNRSEERLAKINRLKGFEDVLRNLENYIITKSDTHLLAISKSGKEYWVLGPEYAMGGRLLDGKHVTNWSDLPSHLKNVGDGVLFPAETSLAAGVEAGVTRFDLLGLVATKSVSNGPVVVARTKIGPKVGDQVRTVRHSDVDSFSVEAKILALPRGGGPLDENYRALRLNKFAIAKPIPFVGDVTFGTKVAVPGKGQYSEAIIWGQGKNAEGTDGYYFIKNDGGKLSTDWVERSGIKSLP